MLKLHSKILTEAQKNHASSNLAIQIFSFFIFFIVCQLVQGIIISIFTMPSIMREMADSGVFDSGGAVSFEDSYNAAMSASMSSPLITISTLYSTIVGILLSILYCRTIEHRSYGSMGFRKEKAFPRYLTGLLIGAAMMSIIVGISVLTGVSGIKISGSIKTGMILVYFFGFLIQGMSEEVMFRGYFMTTIGGKHSALTAIAISSVAFAAAHLANPGISVLAFINLILFGAFAGLYIICFDDIWGAAAIHSIWNFTQGNIFGISVSGTGENDSVFRTTAISEKAWLSGGKFGIEGSIFTTIILAAAIVIVLLCISKKQNIPEAEETSAAQE